MYQRVIRLATIGLLSAACLMNIERDGSQVAHAADLSSSDSSHISYTNFRGRYGFSATGSIPGLGDFVSNGVVIFYPNGTLTATESLNLNGQSFENTYTGSYTLNPDDTGTYTTIDQFGQTSNFSLVLTANRQRGSGVLMNEGALALLKMERQ